MSWISRYGVLISKALVIALLLVAGSLAHAPAAGRDSYVFDGKRITFSHVVSQDGRAAIGVADPGLKSLLGALGATLTWQQGERYVLVTTAEPLVVSFAVGDTEYDVGP
ncbi:MAG: hypothetical protein M3R35_03470, partial [Candidatus Eremiobacteraeota bacterium]|nr:hypothetical protein [Candidatus Eremiobacteraeota bacterium]